MNENENQYNQSGQGGQGGQGYYQTGQGYNQNTGQSYYQTGQGFNQTTGQGYYQSPGQNYYQSQFNQPQTPNRSALSVVALVCSLVCCCCPLIGLILGILDLVINRGKKHGFSIAAIIISAICVVLIFVTNLFGYVTDLAKNGGQSTETSSLAGIESFIDDDSDFGDDSDDDSNSDNSYSSDDSSGSGSDDTLDLKEYGVPLTVGASFGDDDVQYCVSDVNYFPDYDPDAVVVDEGESPILIEVTATNNSKEEQYVSYAFFNFYANGEYAITKTLTGTDYVDNVTLAPGDSGTISMLYVESADLDTAYLTWDSLSGSRAVVDLLS